MDTLLIYRLFSEQASILISEYNFYLHFPISLPTLEEGHAQSSVKLPFLGLRLDDILGHSSRGKLAMPFNFLK